MGFNIQSADTVATQNDYTNFINSFVTNIVNNASLSCTSNQSYNINFGSIPASGGFPSKTCTFQFNNGNINVTQTVSENCNLQSENFNTVIANIQNNITNELSQWITNNLGSNQGWLAIAFSSQSAQNITSQQVAAMISNNAVSNIANQCAAEISNSQSSNISICGVFNNTNFNLTQAAIITNLTSCINKNTVNYIASNSQLNSMAQTADNQLKSSQEGLSTIAKWLIIGAIVVVVLIIIGALLYFVFSSKSGPPKEDGKKAELESLERRVEEKRRLEGAGIPPTSPASHASPYSTHEPFSAYNAENLRSGLESALGRFRE